MEWWSLSFFKRFRNQTTNWRFCLSRWSWSDECWFFRQVFLGFGTHVVATTVCTTRRGVYIHSPVARTFFGCIVCLRTSAHLHTCAHKRMAQVSVKSVCTCVVSLLLAFSLLMSHPSLLFPRGHFETSPDYGFTDDPVHMFLPYLPVLKAQDTRNSAPASRSFGCLAKSDANTGCEPNEFDKITSVDSDTMLIDDLDLHDISDFSNNTHENKGLFGVLTMFESSVSHVSHDDFALKKESKESMQSGKPLLDREKEKKEKVLWSVLQSQCPTERC